MRGRGILLFMRIDWQLECSVVGCGASAWTLTLADAPHGTLKAIKCIVN